MAGFDGPWRVCITYARTWMSSGLWFSGCMRGIGLRDCSPRDLFFCSSAMGISSFASVHPHIPGLGASVLRQPTCLAVDTHSAAISQGFGHGNISSFLFLSALSFVLRLVSFLHHQPAPLILGSSRWSLTCPPRFDGKAPWSHELMRPGEREWFKGGAVLFVHHLPTVACRRRFVPAPWRLTHLRFFLSNFGWLARIPPGRLCRARFACI